VSIGSIKKIIITGDILRPEPRSNKLGNQDPNINWFYHLFAFFIKKITSDIPVYKLSSTIKRKTMFDVELFYQLNGLEPSIESWVKLFYTSKVRKEAEEYFFEFFNNSLVIGYELPKIFIYLMQKLDINYIEFIIHPARFLDDIFFGVKSNDKSVNEKLAGFSLGEDNIYAMAHIHKAALARFKDKGIEKNSALLVGQTKVDRSLIEKGKILSLFDYKGEINKIRETYRTIYFKPHPYASNNNEIIKYLKTIKVKIINENIYYLICQDNIKSIYAISSSVIEESKYFGLNACCFKQDVEYPYFRIFNQYFGSRFWIDILGCFCEVNKKINIIIPDKPNRLRDNLGCYWGYNVFGAENLYKELSKKDRAILSEIFTMLYRLKLLPLYRKIKLIKQKVRLII